MAQAHSIQIDALIEVMIQHEPDLPNPLGIETDRLRTFEMGQINTTIGTLGTLETWPRRCETSASKLVGLTPYSVTC